MEEGALGENNAYRLFVGNLNSRVTEDDLRAILKPFGTAKSIHLVADNVTGLSKGYAFVEMFDRGGAHRAVASLNGKRVDGHFVVARTLF